MTAWLYSQALAAIFAALTDSGPNATSNCPPIATFTAGVMMIEGQRIHAIYKKDNNTLAETNFGDLPENLTTMSEYLINGLGYDEAKIHNVLAIVKATIEDRANPADIGNVMNAMPDPLDFENLRVSLKKKMPDVLMEYPTNQESPCYNLGKFMGMSTRVLNDTRDMQVFANETKILMEQFSKHYMINPPYLMHENLVNTLKNREDPLLSIVTDERNVVDFFSNIIFNVIVTEAFQFGLSDQVTMPNLEAITTKIEPVIEYLREYIELAKSRLLNWPDGVRKALELILLSEEISTVADKADAIKLMLDKTTYQCVAYVFRCVWDNEFPQPILSNQEGVVHVIALESDLCGVVLRSVEADKISNETKEIVKTSFHAYAYIEALVLKRLDQLVRPGWIISACYPYDAVCNPEAGFDFILVDVLNLTMTLQGFKTELDKNDEESIEIRYTNGAAPIFSENDLFSTIKFYGLTWL